MARDLIIADSARITPRKVFGEEITILADHSQTGSYEIYVHDAPEGVGPPLHESGSFGKVHRWPRTPIRRRA